MCWYDKVIDTVDIRHSPPPHWSSGGISSKTFGCLTFFYQDRRPEPINCACLPQVTSPISNPKMPRPSARESQPSKPPVPKPPPFDSYSLARARAQAEQEHQKLVLTALPCVQMHRRVPTPITRPRTLICPPTRRASSRSLPDVPMREEPCLHPALQPRTTEY
jgi:hypothetical protein